jgi:hypothetical protein
MKNGEVGGDDEQKHVGDRIILNGYYRSTLQSKNWVELVLKIV